MYMDERDREFYFVSDSSAPPAASAGAAVSKNTLTDAPQQITSLAPDPADRKVERGGIERDPGIATLKAGLGGLTGVARVSALREGIKGLSLSGRVSVDDALLFLGDLPAPELRRAGLEALLPRMTLPIEASEAVRLLSGFSNVSRAMMLLDLQSCIVRPVASPFLTKLLDGIEAPYRNTLAAELSGNAKCTAVSAEAQQR
jgi:hypothetical protein